jgi:hypothetical protein
VQNKEAMKKLNGLANNVAAMVVAEGASDLYEELMNLPDGTVVIDLLAVRGCLNERFELKTGYVKEISQWFFGRVPDCGVEPKDVSSASVTLSIDGSTVPTNRSNIVHYLAEATVVIEAKGKRFEQSVPVTHVWHKRGT